MVNHQKMTELCLQNKWPNDPWPQSIDSSLSQSFVGATGASCCCGAPTSVVPSWLVPTNKVPNSRMDWMVVVWNYIYSASASCHEPMIVLAWLMNYARSSVIGWAGCVIKREFRWVSSSTLMFCSFWKWPCVIGLMLRSRVFVLHDLSSICWI